MIIVADSGGTKTIWYYSSREKSGTVITSGLHPSALASFTPSDLEAIMPMMAASGRLYFYGSGCLNPEPQSAVLRWLKQHFPLFEIEVHSDLIGTAIALHGENSGIVCILGTGSSLAIWNGNQLVIPVPSLGWMVGDPGSGVDIARRFFLNWYGGKFPKEINQELEKKATFPPAPEFIQKIYSSAHPAKEIASYCTEISQLIHYDSVRRLIQYSFHDFFDHYDSVLRQHATLPLAFSGGIAHAFKPILSAVAKSRGFEIFSVVENPVRQLALMYFSYYSRNLD